jgi:hypothetical protein
LDMALPESVQAAERTAWNKRSAKDFGDGVSLTTFLGGTDGWQPNSPQVSLALQAVGAPTAPRTVEAMGGNGCVSLAWSPVDGAVSYSVKRRKASGDGFDTAVSGWTRTGWIDRDADAGIEREYLITSVSASGKSTDSPPIRATTVIDEGLTQPWALAEGGKGSAAFGNGNLTLKAGDQSPAFAWQPLAGDASLLVHVARCGAGSGIRVQRSTDSKAAFVFLGLDAQGRASLTWGDSGGQPKARVGAELAAPCWLRLTRSRERFSGATSLDGVTWKPIGDAALQSLSGPVCVGLTAAAGETEFDGISFPLQPPAVPESPEDGQ